MYAALAYTSMISNMTFKFAGKNSYSLEQSVEEIQKEIMTNGPVEGAFTVFEDFVQYKTGMYQNSIIFLPSSMN